MTTMCRKKPGVLVGSNHTYGLRHTHISARTSTSVSKASTASVFDRVQLSERTLLYFEGSLFGDYPASPVEQEIHGQVRPQVCTRLLSGDVQNTHKKISMTPGKGWREIVEVHYETHPRRLPRTNNADDIHRSSPMPEQIIETNPKNLDVLKESFNPLVRDQQPSSVTIYLGQ